MKTVDSRVVLSTFACVPYTGHRYRAVHLCLCSLDTGAVLSTIAANMYGKSWKRVPSHRGVCKRASVFAVCACIYLSLWASAFYYNA